MYKVTITWESAEDRVGNETLNLERSALLSKFIDDNKAPKDATIITPKDSSVGIIKANSLEAANEWENTIFLLAQKYNKHILFVSKEEI